MRRLNFVICTVLMGTLRAQPFSVAALLKNSPFQEAAPVVLCDGKLLFQYGVQELRAISRFSENVLFVWRQDGTALLSKKLFDAALSAMISAKSACSTWSAERVSVARGRLYEYQLCEDGDDAAVVAYNSASGVYTVLGIIEQGKSLLLGSKKIRIASATTELSFPHVSWDMVAYSYATRSEVDCQSEAQALVTRVRAMRNQRTDSSCAAAYAYGCGIGYGNAMGMRQAPKN